MKKGSLMLLYGIIIVVVVGFSWVFTDGFTDFGLGAITTPGQIDMEAQCPDDGITTLYYKLENDGAATETFLTGVTSNMNVKNMDTGIIVITENSSSSAWVSEDVNCGDHFKIYAESDPATAGSGESPQFTATGNKMYIILHTTALDKLQFRVKDITNDDWEYLYADNQAVTNSSAYTDMNTTLIYDDNAAGDIAVGTDGYLDILFNVKSATNRKTADDQGKLNSELLDGATASLGLRNFLCIDTGTGMEWDKDTISVTVNDGAKLPDVKSSIDTDSLEYSTLQNSEACYSIGNIGDTAKQINFYIKAKAGEDPDTTNDDITLYFYPEGTYKSSDDSNEIKVGIFSDATTQTPIVYSTKEVPATVIQIS